jgi:hypothetical protein
MIDLETKLKLQAYADNELSERESRDIAALLSRDPEARALCAELKEVQLLVAANEWEVKLPESREFYWSKIERQIRRESAEADRAGERSRLSWWMRLVAPAAGLALVLITTLLLIKPAPAPSQLSQLHEIETALDEANTISFRSESAGMTVVWVQTQGQ